ncbi:hypothetical protein [Marivivens marinus]|uniref:hypothetical protein n=1 Tax=Marivivens marinus TaxID=3110173 RepID=UPI003B847871
MLTTEKEGNARSVVNRVNKIIQAGHPTFEKYDKGGTKVSLEKELPETVWSGAILAGLKLAQSIGSGWQVSGFADEELTLVSSSFSVSGIEWACFSLQRNQTEAAISRNR